ncbi:MAG: AFG1 family ATPase [Betaproteobacteria bacterium]|nr:AFG1 family ATPase [Betaproteobacteria bacterium]
MQSPAFRERLEQLAQARQYQLDGAQLAVCKAFTRLEAELTKRESRGLLSLFNRPASLRGIYLCGPVGRGKTFLMDAFYGFTREPRKERVHFHHFMQQVHAELRALQGKPNPLQFVAQSVAERARVLCLDEFHVTDIGDAMILSGLLYGLFDAGVALVTTSNDPPDQLYSHGLQRARFLPAIDHIKRHLEYVSLQGEADYRLRHLQKAGVFHSPLSEAAHAEMREGYHELTGEPSLNPTTLEIEDRPVAALSTADGVAWFTFTELCETARGTADYIELARRFHTVLIEGVPQFQPATKESLRRLIWLVDEFYDRRVNLVLSAEATIEQLFSAVQDVQGVARTESRLIEMQTLDYLTQPHLA